MSRKIQTECPHCREFVWVWYVPEDKGQTYGPPENCWEPAPAELEPIEAECPHCHEEFDEDDVDRMLEQVEEDEANQDDGPERCDDDF